MNVVLVIYTKTTFWGNYFSKRKLKTSASARLDFCFEFFEFKDLNFEFFGLYRKYL